LNKLSINKKPKKTVTNDLDVQRLTKYTNVKKPTKTSTKTTTKTSKPATKTKVKASVTSNMGTGAGSSKKSNAALKSSNASILSPKTHLKNQLKEEWLAKMKDITKYRGR
jgi:hypothetical protein